jgi:outer membrane protein assembly factor BamB
MSSVSALVSSGGRIFYIFDEGSRAAIQLPPKWKLIARDAFNGTVLWKRDIPLWYTHLYPLKSGPAFLARRLVAVGDRVYATLGLGRPLVALDPATGKTVRTYANTKGAEEVLHSGGELLVLVNPEPLKPDRYTWKGPVCWDEGNRISTQRAWNEKRRSILALDAKTGAKRWAAQSAVAPVTMCADEGRVAFHDGEKVVCLDRKTGKPKWASEPVTMRRPLPTWYAPTLVLADGVALFAGGNGKMSGFDIETGRKLWTNQHNRAGHRSPEDLLVIGGLAWSGKMAGRGADNRWTGYDIKTGKVVREFKPNFKSYWFHHRCHRSKATTKYIMPSRTGIEYVDWRKETWDRNHWIRGACVYGVMPANGLTYVPQHPCACYLETKLNGFNAVAPAAKTPLPKPSEAARLVKGPAYSQIGNRKSKIGNQDWPTYRHDATRSGCATTAVPAKIAPAWQTKLGGRLSAVVVAGGKLFVAAIDAHTVHALDAADGKELWRFTAGGRVDSPPTIHNGCAIFGSADGWVYCVRASDGKLAWQYLAAPAERKHMAFGQLESVWPVHGSVLVRSDPSAGSGQAVVYCVGGRSAFLDGGMRLCRIDAATGKLLGETILDENLPGTKDNLQTVMKGLNLPTALPDVLSSDDKHVYMRSQVFTLDGKRTEVTSPDSPVEQVGDDTHLFCSIGFLDDSGFHRAYWMYGRKVTSGCNYWFRAGRHAPAGRLLVFDDDTVYGYGRKPHYFVWSPALEYRLYAAEKHVKPESVERVTAGRRGLDKKSRRWIFNRTVTGSQTVKQLSAVDLKWSQNEPPLYARAMALAGKTLFVAGPPDVLDEEAAVSRRFDADVQKGLAEQDAALAGQRGALLWAVSAGDGKRLAELKLDAPPVWDGMAAAGGRLYLATTDGKVRCFAGK